MVWVPGGEFLMGSEHRLARPNERPAHSARIGGFWMDRCHVTNAEFRAFVVAIGYVTTAERKPDWEALKVQLPPGTPPPEDAELQAGAMVFVGADEPVPLEDYTRWWRFVPGANWQHPRGPGSSIEGKDDHPVVQVSHEDAIAYAHWSGKRLPTEAEWEFAARGGLEQATYAWGEGFQPAGQAMANTWRGSMFPVVSPKAGAAVGTTPVGTFPPNGYGLADMTGNAWQWVSDWYRADAFRRLAIGVAVNPAGPDDSLDPDEPGVPANAPKRVIRGGSFLCNEAYCLSYRPSARRGNDPHNPMSHLGFRLVMDEAAWPRHVVHNR
jgi:sulfatase modifying factor 1